MTEVKGEERTAERGQRAGGAETEHLWPSQCAWIPHSWKWSTVTGVLQGRISSFSSSSSSFLSEGKDVTEMLQQRTFPCTEERRNSGDKCLQR